MSLIVMTKIEACSKEIQSISILIFVMTKIETCSKEIIELYKIWTFDS